VARAVVLSGSLERRVAQLDRLLPIERPWRRGRRLSDPKDTIQVWDLHPDELRELPRPGQSLGFDVTPLIRRRLAQVARDVKARRYAAALAALDDAEALYNANAPAIRQERLRDAAAETRQRRAGIAEWSKKGSEAKRRKAAPQIEQVVRTAQQLRRQPQFAQAGVMALARALRNPPHRVPLSLSRIRHILSDAGL
jgi:hypothetical protein